MQVRSVAWRWPLMLAGSALVGMFALSVLGAPWRSDTIIAVDVADAPGVIRHAIPRGMRALGRAARRRSPPQSGSSGRSMAGSPFPMPRPTPRGCAVVWYPERGKFMDPCLGQVFDATGLNVGGPAPRGLDAYPVTAKSETLIEVNLSRPQAVSHH